MSTRKMFDRLGREFNRSFDKLEAEIAQWRDASGRVGEIEAELTAWRDAAGLIPGDETAHDPGDLTPDDLRRWMDENDRRISELESELRVRTEQLSGAVDEAIRLSTRLVEAGVVSDPEGDTADAQIRRLAREMARIARAAGMPDRDVYVIVAETVDSYEEAP